MCYSNIIQNNSPSSYGVIYSEVGSLKIHYCIFNMNQNTLISVSTGTLELSHCHISHSGFVSTGIDNSLTKKQTYQIWFFNSQYCKADLPINIQIPIRTLELTPKKSGDSSILITMNNRHFLENLNKGEICIIMTYTFLLPL